MGRMAAVSLDGQSKCLGLTHAAPGLSDFESLDASLHDITLFSQDGVVVTLLSTKACCPLELFLTCQGLLPKSSL